MPVIMLSSLNCSETKWKQKTHFVTSANPLTWLLVYRKKVCFIIFGSFKCSLTGEAEPPMLESGTWEIFMTEALKVKRQVVH